MRTSPQDAGQIEPEERIETGKRIDALSPAIACKRWPTSDLLPAALRPVRRDRDRSSLMSGCLGTTPTVMVPCPAAWRRGRAGRGDDARGAHCVHRAQRLTASPTKRPPMRATPGGPVSDGGAPAAVRGRGPYRIRPRRPPTLTSRRASHPPRECRPPRRLAASTASLGPKTRKSTPAQAIIGFTTSGSADCTAYDFPLPARVVGRHGPCELLPPAMPEGASSRRTLFYV